MEFSDYHSEGNFVTNSAGTVYEVVKVNRVNTVCRDRDGKLWNVRGVLKKTEKPADWVDADVPNVRPGAVFRLKKSAGLFGRSFFTQYGPETFFVATDATPIKVNFVPLGAKGLPEYTKGYSCATDSVEIVDLDVVFGLADKL